MIVNYTDKGWEIITQRAHGLLAMQIGMQWREQDRPERWAETLLAIAEHDDAQMELNAKQLLTPQGGPLNYSMNKFNLANCEFLQKLSITKSRYIALLTSLHMQFLYGKEAKTNPVAKKYLQQQQIHRKKWSKELGLTIAKSKQLYALLEWCDAFSLLICQQLMQAEQRSIEVSQDSSRTKYQLYQLNETTLTVYPWPFGTKSFSVSYESRILPDMQFKNAGYFHDQFIKAAVIEKTWHLQQAATPRIKKKV